jgi:hypothetical protein
MDCVRQEVVPVKSCVESACKMREKERFRAVYYGDRAKNILKLLYIIFGWALSRDVPYHKNDNCEVRTHAPEETRTLTWRLRPLGQVTYILNVRYNSVYLLWKNEVC